MLLPDLEQNVDDLVRDRDQVIGVAARSTAIAAALERLSADAPFVRSADVTSDDGGQRLPVPTGWVSNWSELRGLEYPLGRTPPSWIGLDAAHIYRGPDDEEIVLVISLFAGDVVRVRFTQPHELTALASTVPVRFNRALACLAASDLCGQLAAHYATEGEPTISADSVDHQGKSGRWRSRARDLAAEYTRIVGTTRSDANKPAMATTSFASTDSLGRRTLFHPPSNWPRR